MIFVGLSLEVSRFVLRSKIVQLLAHGITLEVWGWHPFWGLGVSCGAREGTNAANTHTRTARACATRQTSAQNVSKVLVRLSPQRLTFGAFVGGIRMHAM